MTSFKLTPTWMFIFLLAILIIPVFIGKGYSYGEGFTNRVAYLESNVTGYANKVWPIVTSSMHFDKANGNIVLQTGSTVDKIISRKGDETGSSGSVIKLDSPLTTAVESAWTSWSATRDKNQLFYMPWDKTTFVHLATSGVHTSGFCFNGSDKFVGEYDANPHGITRTHGYTSLPVTNDDRLETHPMFKKKVFHLKNANLLYDISSGCIIVPQTAASIYIFDRAGQVVNYEGVVTASGTKSDSLKIVTEGTDKDDIDFSLGANGKYTLMSGKEFKPWIFNIAIGTGAEAAEKAVTDAKADVVTKTTAKTIADAAVTTAGTTASTTLTTAANVANTTLVTATNTLNTAVSALNALVTKSVVIMPYGVKTLIATFVKESDTVKLIDVKRFDESGLVAATTNTNTNTNPTTPPPTPPPKPGDLPSADSAISEYYKWYWYWNKAGKTMSDDYMLKTQVVPPVCPSCPVASCPATSIVSQGTSGVGGTPITSTINSITGTTGDVIKSLGSGATNIGLGAVDLAKGTVGETADLARDVVGGTTGLARDVVGGTVGLAAGAVGGTVGLARDAVGGTVGLAKDVVGGTVGLAKDMVGGTVDLAKGAFGSRSGSNSGSYGSGSYGSGSNSGSYGSGSGPGPTDPYTYNGALKLKPTSKFMPITADFSAFSR